jgi:hypothetical protein
VAKKYNRGRQQKRNIDRNKLEKYREEIARELGVELPEKRRSPLTRGSAPAFTFEDDTPLL